MPSALDHNRTYDVAVIGGGPIGSQVAFRLAGQGCSVIVLERQIDAAAPVCCTGIISHECINAFGIDSHVILRQFGGGQAFSPSGKQTSLFLNSPIACVIERSKLDTLFANRACEASAHYVYDCAVESVHVDADSAQVQGISAGSKFSIGARAVVVASGFSPAFHRSLKLGGFGDWVTGAQIEVESRVDEVEVYIGRKTTPGFFGWLVPTVPRRALVGLMARRHSAMYLTRFLDSLRREGKITSVIGAPGYRGIPLQPLSRTYRNRLLVVGAAAGQVKPTTGGGIYFGLLCADIAATTLVQALTTNNLTTKALSEYEIEWKKKLGWELRAGRWARRLAEHLNDRQIDIIFDIINNVGVSNLLNTKTISFDWHGRTALEFLHLTTGNRERVLSSLKPADVPQTKGVLLKNGES